MLIHNAEVKVKVTVFLIRCQAQQVERHKRDQPTCPCNEFKALVEQMKATSEKHKESSRRLNRSEQQRNTAMNENDGLHRLQCDLQQRTKQLKIDLKRVRRDNKKAARSKRVKKSTGKDEIEFISSSDDDDFL